MTVPTMEVTHLFAAEALDTSKWWISRITMCGKEVRGLNPDDPDDPDDPAEDPDLTTTYRHCPDCVTEAENAYLASDDDGAFVLHVFVREPDHVARKRWEATR